jgi:hypothetical protein
MTGRQVSSGPTAGMEAAVKIPGRGDREAPGKGDKEKEADPAKDSSLGHKVYTGAVGAAASMVARKGLRAVWSAVAKHEPPEEPADPEVAFRDAALWAVGSAALVALVRLAATRRANSVWKLIAGEPPGAAVEAD